MTPLRVVSLAALLSLFSGCGGQLIGTPCRTSQDCGSGGAYCEFRVPGGYCSRTCRSNLDCGPDGLCIGPVTAGLCRAKCDDPGGRSSCRDGYRCVASPGDVGGFCDPDPSATGAGGGGGANSSVGGGAPSGSGGGASAGGAGGSGGGAPAAPVASLAFLFPTLTIAHETIELVSDGQGVLHAAFKRLSWLDTLLDERNGGISYARCVSNCGSPNGWSTVSVGVGLDPQLAVGTDGVVHLVWATDGGSQSRDGFRYARCSSNCLATSGWTSVEQFDVDFGIRIRGRRALRVAPNGALSAAFVANGDLYYASCNSDCSTVGSWMATLLRSGVGKTQASVALTTGGTPRVVASMSGLKALAWFTCESGCQSASGWTTTWLYDADGDAVALQLDPSGRPRVAFNQGNAGTSGERFRSWYVGCDANCHDPKSWNGRDVGVAFEGMDGLELVLVGATPMLALESKTGAMVYRCTGNCGTLQPTLAISTLESNDGLAAIQAPTNLAGCTAPVWSIGSGIALAVDPTGKHLTALFEAVSITHCPGEELAADTLRVYDLVIP